jgi:DNA-binding PadR family transcriptional regulator
MLLDKKSLDKSEVRSQKLESACGSGHSQSTIRNWPPAELIDENQTSRCSVKLPSELNIMRNRSKQATARAAVDRHLPLRPVACAVLASLADRPRPGFDVLEAVNGTVPGRPLLGPGTLYRLMRELRQAALIERADPTADPGDDRQVHHTLTTLGRAVLDAELDRLRRTLTLAARARRTSER